MSRSDPDARLWADVARSISEASAERFTIRERQAESGGSINATWRVTGTTRACFVKVAPAAQSDMLSAEAAGLAELARAGALRVPQVICDGANDAASWLVLEHVELGGHVNARALGAGLAALHSVRAPRFGWHRDNTIGSTMQINAQCGDWIEFWRAHRLGFQLALAARNGAPHALLADGERLADSLPALFGGCPVTPSLLHGDLWRGNVGADRTGAPVVFDPAVYYGHHEADIAMTELFGGFDAAFYDAYRAASALDAGYGVRKHLYNLYHVLNHYNLFGGSYAHQAGRLLARLLAEIR